MKRAGHSHPMDESGGSEEEEDEEQEDGDEDGSELMRASIQERQQRFECDLEASQKKKSRSNSPRGMPNARGQNSPGDEEDDELHKLAGSFQQAVSSHSWELAERFISRADAQRLNDGLCIALDSVWFLSSQEELCGAVRLIEKIVEAGASEYNRAALRTSFLASCVSACRSRTMSLADTVTVMAQRLRDRLQECNGDQEMKAEAAAKVQKFKEWALRCIGSHTRSTASGGGKSSSSSASSIISAASLNQSQLQLMAFKRFLQLAGHNLTPKDYTEAFDAACFPLTLFSSAIDPGWATGIAASAMQGLLSMLLQGGADNVNQCFLEAARFGSTELVRILLQISRNGPELDVDLALGFASHYSKIGTMECLVQEGRARSFLGPLMRASERGCMQVVEWFVVRGCMDMELCLALTAAVSSSKLEAAAYLLRHVPRYVLETLSSEILKAAGERSGGSLRGIDFLLGADFLGDPEATYAVADAIATSEDEVSPELKGFLQQEWSQEAFDSGRAAGADHYVNLMRVVRRGRSGLSLQELPMQLQATVAYLPLYKECAGCGGVLVSQRMRGLLVEALSRLGGSGFADEGEVCVWRKESLLGALRKQLPAFLV